MSYNKLGRNWSDSARAYCYIMLKQHRKELHRTFWRRVWKCWI